MPHGQEADPINISSFPGSAALRAGSFIPSNLLILGSRVTDRYRFNFFSSEIGKIENPFFCSVLFAFVTVIVKYHGI